MNAEEGNQPRLVNTIYIDSNGDPIAALPLDGCMPSSSPQTDLPVGANRKWEAKNRVKYKEYRKAYMRKYREKHK